VSRKPSSGGREKKSDGESTSEGGGEKGSGCVSKGGKKRSTILPFPYYSKAHGDARWRGKKGGTCQPEEKEKVKKAGSCQMEKKETVTRMRGKNNSPPSGTGGKGKENPRCRLGKGRGVKDGGKVRPSRERKKENGRQTASRNGKGEKNTPEKKKKTTHRGMKFQKRGKIKKFPSYKRGSIISSTPGREGGVQLKQKKKKGDRRLEKIRKNCMHHLAHKGGEEAHRSWQRGDAERYRTRKGKHLPRPVEGHESVKEVEKKGSTLDLRAQKKGKTRSSIQPWYGGTGGSQRKSPLIRWKKRGRKKKTFFSLSLKKKKKKKKGTSSRGGGRQRKAHGE